MSTDLCEPFCQQIATCTLHLQGSTHAQATLPSTFVLKWVGARGGVHSHMSPLPNPRSPSGPPGPADDRPHGVGGPLRFGRTPHPPIQPADGPRPPDSGFGFQTGILVVKLIFWFAHFCFCFRTGILVFKLLFWFSNCFVGFQTSLLVFKLVFGFSTWFYFGSVIFQRPFQRPCICRKNQCF